jgi:threonine dehydratase
LTTPLERAPAALGNVWLKREDAHELGVFKWRGALPVVAEFARRGHHAVVTSSTGNHGAAVAWACRRHGANAVVFVPPGAAEQKLALLDRLGADVRVAGRDFDEAKGAARVFAEEAGVPFYEDGAEPLQYDAYGAIGDEILDQLPSAPAAVVTPIGNGALAAGIGAVLGRRAPEVLRVGVVASEMPVMAASYEAGQPVDVPSGTTIADGLAVRVAIPLAVARLLTTVDLIVPVSEQAIASALVACHDSGVLIEPSAAAALAALRDRPDLGDGGPVVLVITGRNVDEAVVESARSARPERRDQSSRKTSSSLGGP